MLIRTYEKFMAFRMRLPAKIISAFFLQKTGRTAKAKVKNLGAAIVRSEKIETAEAREL